MALAPRTLTLLRLIAAMFLWGGTWIAGRIIAQALEAPLAVASLRFFLAALALGLYARLTGQALRHPRTPAAWAGAWSLGFFGIFLYGLCFFFGLQHIAAGQGALVVALNPVLVILVAWLLGQEPMTPRKGIGAAIALVGSLTVIGHGDPRALWQGGIGPGEWLIVGCVLTWTAYTFIGRQTTHHLGSLGTTLYASLTGATLLGIAALVQGGIDPGTWTLEVWGSMVFLALFGTAIAYTWFTAAVHELGAGQASLYINLVPVFAVLQAAWLLDEHLAWPVLLGGLLVIGGVWLATQLNHASARSTPLDRPQPRS